MKVQRLDTKRRSSGIDPRMLPRPLSGGRTAQRQDQKRDDEQVRMLEKALRSVGADRVAPTGPVAVTFPDAMANSLPVEPA